MPANPRIEDLRRRLQREPGSRLFAQLAEELRKDGEHAEAVRVSREGLARHPNYPSARMTLGRALFDSGDLAGARVEFESVVRSAPDNILASRLLAESLEGLGDLESAALRYREALRLAPGDKQIAAHLDNLNERLEDLRRAAAAAPRGADEDFAPIPLAAVSDETFELERPAESIAAPVVARQAVGGEREAAATATLVEQSEREAEFEFLGETEPTIPFRPAPDLEAAPGGEPAPSAGPMVFEELAPAAEAAGEGPPALSSATLAELYLSQGAAPKAAEVYRQLLEREPGNERARLRLAEIEASPAGRSDRPPETPEQRRARLQRTLVRLEQLGAAVRRH